MEVTLQKIERSYIKLSLGLLFGFLLLIFLCWGGWHFFQGWQAQRLTRRAAAYLNIGDFKSAILTGRHAFQLDPEKVAAVRVVAEAAERSEIGRRWIGGAKRLSSIPIPVKTRSRLSGVRCRRATW